jgi:hypothetical protein
LQNNPDDDDSQSQMTPHGDGEGDSGSTVFTMTEEEELSMSLTITNNAQAMAPPSGSVNNIGNIRAFIASATAPKPTAAPAPASATSPGSSTPGPSSPVAAAAFVLPPPVTPAATGVRRQRLSSTFVSPPSVSDTEIETEDLNLTASPIAAGCVISLT